MRYFKIIIFAFISINMNQLNAQNIESHKWKSRVLLVLTDDLSSTVFKNQIEELQAHENGLKDRKLMIYQIKKDGFKSGLTETGAWQKSTQAYKKYKKSKTDFEVILIGLDGGVKLTETDLISCETLFRIIDVMPMRQSELNNR